MEAVITCPSTGEAVPIGLETDAKEWDRLGDYGMTVCEACGEQHWWNGGEVSLRPLAEPTRN